MCPESKDPEETGLNSSFLKYLLIPYFKQLWFSGFTWTTQSTAKLRKPDSPVLVLYVLRIYSWRLQSKTVSKDLLFTIQEFNPGLLPSWNHTSCTHRAVWARGCCLALFIGFISAEPSCCHRCKSNKQTSFQARAPVLPVLQHDTHLSSARVSDSSTSVPTVQVPGFHFQPVHADLQISSSLLRLGSLLNHPTFDIQIPIFKLHTFTYRVLHQASWNGSCN